MIIDILYQLAMIALVACGGALIGYCLKLVRSADEPAAEEDSTADRYSAAERAAGLAGDRDGLIKAMIRAYDLSENPQARTHIQRELRSVGVVPIDIRPRGPLDETRHIPVSYQPTGNSADAGLIAVEHRIGWQNHDHKVIRQAEVATWVAADHHR
ncbi:hypothetical protein [Nocardia sp. alder85J]|uniref:hypothetical protein n=1 Tax=Nocardia sp. alder85J TaxID=2862949 RepID=UPI001CD66D11|nr:hypothetical protein [Nocardia sp. alder85J]MCX4090917.1 hypothetical protein [Nocardia sp. alder85J]